MASIDDVIGTFPTLVTRINMLEQRTCPKIAMDLAELQTEVKELSRRLNVEQSYSLKARRAYAPDAEAGLAAASAGGP